MVQVIKSHTHLPWAWRLPPAVQPTEKINSLVGEGRCSHGRFVGTRSGVHHCSTFTPQSSSGQALRLDSLRCNEPRNLGLISAIRSTHGKYFCRPTVGRHIRPIWRLTSQLTMVQVHQGQLAIPPRLGPAVQEPTRPHPRQPHEHHGCASPAHTVQLLQTAESASLPRPAAAWLQRYLTQTNNWMSLQARKSFFGSGWRLQIVGKRDGPVFFGLHGCFSSTWTW